MPAQQLDHINMTVASFSESADYYRRLFGFEIVEDEVSDGVRWGVLRAGNAMLCIYEHPDYAFADRHQSAKQKRHNVAHFALRITDEPAWIETVRRNKVPINYGGVVNWPHSKSWYVTDPTGYEIEVVLWNDDSITFAPLRPGTDPGSRRAES